MKQEGKEESEGKEGKEKRGNMMDDDAEGLKMCGNGDGKERGSDEGKKGENEGKGEAWEIGDGERLWEKLVHG